MVAAEGIEREQYIAMDDQQAITKVLAGDQEAFRLLVERHHPGLIRYVYGMIGDEMAAHDIAQEAFITAYQKLRQYKPKFAFSTWLYRIARNLAYQDMKYHQAWAPYDDEADAAPDDANPAEQVERQIVADDVRRAMARLRPQWRSVVQLYYWEDKSYQEIADTLGVPINTVRVWLSRAKQAMRSELV